MTLFPPQPSGADDASDSIRPWLNPPPPDGDPVVWANRYLSWVRQRSLQADWIAITSAEVHHLAVLTVIGERIHDLNQRLNDILIALLSCLRPEEQPAIHLVAAPIALKVGIDGFCNLNTQPITLVVDPSRIAPVDWPHLVVHELAHALSQGSGHGPRFFEILSSLCLAQDLPIPPSDSLQRGVLPYWPPCRPNPDANLFWVEGRWSASLP